MNNKIVEIVEQADKDFQLALVPAEILEKFAKLIVMECADVCERFGESGDGYTCSAEILEHFGVEFVSKYNEHS